MAMGIHGNSKVTFNNACALVQRQLGLGERKHTGHVLLGGGGGGGGLAARTHKLSLDLVDIIFSVFLGIHLASKVLFLSLFGFLTIDSKFTGMEGIVAQEDS
ncbi:hypothetical protein ACJX0J_006583 [Zea mays]